MQFYSASELASLTGTSSNQVHRWIAAGELNATNFAVNGSGQRPHWKISQSDWDDFVASRASIQPKAEAPVPRRRKHYGGPDYLNN